MVKKDGKNIIIEITDKGIGIPTEDYRHIGSRFFRASNAGHIQGTGLGLNIVKSYLQYLNGHLAFNNNENGGTTFTLTLPAIHEA